MRAWMKLSPLLCAALVAWAAHAEGLDRDTLLTDSPATPDKGTIRVSAGGEGEGKPADGATGTTGGVVGSISWTPIRHLTADVGAFYQSGDSGPSARLRYQIFTQEQIGVDLGTGVRFKTVGFHPDQGEIEFIVAAGRRLGQWDLILNGVFGVETAGGGGKDIEVKAFGGYRFSDAVRAGIDSRLQAEVSDQENTTVPKVGRDADFRAGPSVSWLVTRTIQLQALVGVGLPKKTDYVGPIGVVTASIDF